MKLFLRAAWAFLRRDATVTASYRLSFLMQIGSMVFGVISVYFIAKLMGHNPLFEQYGGYLPFAVVGMSMTNFYTTGFDSFSSAIRNEQNIGTLESILMTPTPLATVIAASSLWAFAWNALTTALTILLASALFHIQLKGSLLTAGAILLLTTITISCMGIVSASFIMIFKKGDPIKFLFGTMSFFLGGVVYPVSQLPGWLQKVAQLLPITHGLQGMRDILLAGMGLRQVLPQLLILLLFTAIGLPLSLYSFSVATRIARREGSLLHY